MSKAKEIMERLGKAKPNQLSRVLTFDVLVSAITGEDDISGTNEKLFELVKDALKEAFEELEARAIPEDVEWPTVDGRKVDFHTIYRPNLGVLEAVSIYSNGACEVMSHDGIIKNVSKIHIEVLAADGEPLEVGQTVWDTTKWEERTVTKIVDDKGEFCVELHGLNPGYDYMRPSDLTHQRQALAADGKPIKVGDEVYLCDKYRDRACSSSPKSSLFGIYGDTCMHVEKVCGNRIHVKEKSAFCPSEWLTHEKPGECINTGDFVYLNDDHRKYAERAEYESKGSNYSLCGVSAYERLLVDNIIDGVAVFVGKAAWCPVEFLTKEKPFEVCQGSIVVLDEEHERYADSEWYGSEKPTYSLNGVEAGEPVMVDEVDGGTAYLDKYVSWCPVSWLKKYENDTDSWENVMEDIEDWGGEDAKKFVLRCHEIARRENGR